MNSVKTDRFEKSVITLAWVGSLVLVLAPWFRNRGYLHDLYDYGIFMSASSRLQMGEKPYVDFVTPVQSVSLWLNTTMESLWGGTYQGMTMGNAVLILFAWGVLGIMLTKRWHPIVACLLASTVMIGSAGQHTIIWYNSVGVIALALVCWSTAIAPLIARRTLGWHFLTSFGLLIGGMNKLNFHLVGIVVAFVWAARCGLLKQASWKKVGATLLIWGLMGLVAPLALELAWSGASWDQWRYNVIDLATSSRNGFWREIFNSRLYLESIHDYYGATFRATGVIAGVWFATVSCFGLRKRGAGDRFLVLASGVFGFLVTVALLVTNIEIVYMTCSALVVLITAIWLGFDLPFNGSKLRWLLIGPTLTLGAVMWDSAWKGQRSLYGNDVVKRSEYRGVEVSDPSLGYLRGTKFPHMVAKDIETMTTVMESKFPDRIYRCFYARGSEWMEHIWPSQRIAGLPLWMSPLTYGEVEIENFGQLLQSRNAFHLIVAAKAWAFWPGELLDLAHRHSSREELDGYELLTPLYEFPIKRLGHAEDALKFISVFGGNLDPDFLNYEKPIWLCYSSDNQLFLGVVKGEGDFAFGKHVFRIHGDVILKRHDLSSDQAIVAEFLIVDSEWKGEGLKILWSKLVTLPAEKNETTHSYMADTFGVKPKFVVRVKPEASGLIWAGWHLPHIQHAGDSSSRPPDLRKPAQEEMPIDISWSRALLPEDLALPCKLIVRGGFLGEGGLEIGDGGEIWLSPEIPIKGMVLRFRALPGETEAPGLPFIRVVWYKGGRLQIMHQVPVANDDEGILLRVWPAEYNGWFGVLADRGNEISRVRVSVESVEYD